MFASWCVHSCLPPVFMNPSVCSAERQDTCFAVQKSGFTSPSKHHASNRALSNPPSHSALDFSS